MPVIVSDPVGFAGSSDLLELVAPTEIVPPALPAGLATPAELIDLAELVAPVELVSPADPAELVAPA